MGRREQPLATAPEVLSQVTGPAKAMLLPYFTKMFCFDITYYSLRLLSNILPNMLHRSYLLLLFTTALIKLNHSMIKTILVQAKFKISRLVYNYVGMILRTFFSREEPSLVKCYYHMLDFALNQQLNTKMMTLTLTPTIVILFGYQHII